MMMEAHQGPATSMQYNARACYSVLLDFKGVCRNVCKGTSSSLAVFPLDPHDLPVELYAAAYGGSAPAPCPLNVDALMWLATEAHERTTAICR